MNMRDKRLSLSLSPITLASAKPDSHHEATKLPPIVHSYDNESNIHQDVKITFTLPSGELFEETVKNGETVQEIKRKLYSADKIPTNSDFYFNGKPMLGPLSLNDIPGVDGRSVLEIEVKVSGNTEQVKHNSGEGGQKDGSTNNIIQHKDKDKTENEELVYSGNGKDESTKETQPQTETTAPPTTSNADTNTDINTNTNTTNTTTTDTPNTIISANFVDPDTSSPNSQSTIPSLPHAAFDDTEPLPPPATPKESKNKDSATIDVKDDGEEIKIESLGSGRRWRMCYLV